MSSISDERRLDSFALSRRRWLRAASAGLGAWTALGVPSPAAAQGPTGKGSTARGPRTRFRVACMTLPYSRFPFQRALTGLQSAGYRYVAWGTTHQESGNQRVPVLAEDAPLDRAKELGKRCRDLGLEPLLMFGPSPEAVEALKNRIRQATPGGHVPVG